MMVWLRKMSRDKRAAVAPLQGFVAGSLGNYAGMERKIHTLTIELPTASPRQGAAYFNQLKKDIHHDNGSGPFITMNTATRNRTKTVRRPPDRLPRSRCMPPAPLQVRFQLIMDHARDVILFVRCRDGKNHRCQSGRPQNLLATPAKELLALSIFDLRQVKASEQIVAQMEKADTLAKWPPL